MENLYNSMNKKVKSCLQGMYIDDIYCDKDGIWFVGINDNILYRIDCNNEICPVKMIPYENRSCFRNSSVCYKKEKKVYCFPEREKKICIFDIEKDIIEDIELESNEERLSIFNAWLIDDFVWCVSFRNNRLYMINKNSQKIEKVFLIPYKNYAKSDIEATCFEKKLYFVSDKSVAIMEFDTETLEFNEYCLECEEYGFATIAVNEDTLFVTGAKHRLYCYNLRSREVSIIDLNRFIEFEYKDETYSGNIFYRSIILKEYIILSTENISQLISNQIIIVNTAKKTINVLKFQDKKERKAGDYLIISKYSDCEIIIYDNLNGSMYLYNLYDQKLKEYNIQVCKAVDKSFWKDMENTLFYKETDIVDLEKYLQVIFKQSNEIVTIT